MARRRLLRLLLSAVAAASLTPWSARSTASAQGSAARTVLVLYWSSESFPGTHELVIDAPFEQLRLVHEARDRRVFADGALSAAEWLQGKKGVFTMSDVLQHGGETNR